MTPPPGLIIRRGRAADAAMLADLAARTFCDAFGAQNTAEDLAQHLASHYSLDLQAAELADPDMTTLIAEVADAPAGFAQVAARPAPPDLPAGGGLFLSRFYLEQTWIGRGVAQVLMAAVLESARERGASYLWLTVWEENPRAVAFYEKWGFVKAGRTTFIVGEDPQVDWLMTCTL
ncbi:MAG: GNAT family N-acetyltransferase [Gemmatimonadota bacterium]